MDTASARGDRALPRRARDGLLSSGAKESFAPLTAKRMATDDEKPVSASALERWKISRVETDEEYTQDMSHEDLESLALKLKGYGEEAERKDPSLRGDLRHR